MSRWTEQQERILAEFCERGAKACRDMIERATGVSRSVEATQRHASRLGIPLTVRATCPRCGRVGRVSKRSGLCPVCHQRHLEERTKRGAEIRKEVMRSENDKAVAEARRAYDRARQRQLRARKKV